MSAKKKSAAAALALVGAVVLSGLATGAMAEMGPGGEDRAARMMEMFGTIDANADGKVTQEELAAYRTATFAAADTNSDGTLSSDELAARELARFTESLPDRTARVLERQDANGDGSLSADEIGEGPLEERFARIDSDNDGAISTAEAEAAMSRGGEGRGDRKHGDRGGWFN